MSNGAGLRRRRFLSGRAGWRTTGTIIQTRPSAHHSPFGFISPYRRPMLGRRSVLPIVWGLARSSYRPYWGVRGLAGGTYAVACRPTRLPWVSAKKAR
jgi:hypothetical protein